MLSEIWAAAKGPIFAPKAIRHDCFHPIETFLASSQSVAAKK
jgi:hypothetical protein